jgi:hypothetical protein
MASRQYAAIESRVQTALAPAAWAIDAQSGCRIAVTTGTMPMAAVSCF